MLKDSPAATVSDLVRWLISNARLAMSSAEMDQSFVERLLAAGIPISRFGTGLPSLHPQVDSFSTLWEEGKGFTLRQFKREDLDEAEVSKNAVLAAYSRGETTWSKLEEPPKEGESSMLSELRGQGFTDYLVIPLPFSDGSNKAVGYATRQPGGFSDDEVYVLQEIKHAVASVMETRYLRHMAGTLMDTYVGSVAGRRVLDGEIKRGAGEAIRAAIWFCDLKGFTELSETLESHVLLDLLNAYFETVTGAIDAHQGEVLKFIGDAVLAIFPVEGGTEESAVENALEAAKAARADLATVNTERRELKLKEIDCGIALHFGTVFYGNVGGKSRLDFTVIGPSVNLASRIESLTRALGEDILLSADFVKHHSGEFKSRGNFQLKGIQKEQTVFALID